MADNSSVQAATAGTTLLLLFPQPGEEEELIVTDEEAPFTRTFIGIISAPMGVGDMPRDAVKFPADYF